MKEIITLQTNKYIITYTKDVMQIGCENYTHKEWGNFIDEEIEKMDNGALDWWKKHKNWIFESIKLNPAI